MCNSYAIFDLPHFSQVMQGSAVMDSVGEGTFSSVDDSSATTGQKILMSAKVVVLGLDGIGRSLLEL